MKNNYSPKSDTQCAKQKLADSPRSEQFVSARHYKVDTHYKQPPFLLPSQNIARATPPLGFLDKSRSCPERGRWSSRDVNHAETSNCQCMARGGNRPPITAMTGKNTAIAIGGAHPEGTTSVDESPRHSKPLANHVTEHPLLPSGLSPDKCISSLLTSISNEPT